MVNFAPVPSKYEKLTNVLSWIVFPAILIIGLLAYVPLWMCTGECTVATYHFIIPTVLLLVSIIAVVKERYAIMSTFLVMSVLFFGVLAWLYTR